MPIGNRTEDDVDYEATEPTTQQAEVLLNASFAALGAAAAFLACGLIGIHPTAALAASGGLAVLGSVGLIIAARRRSEAHSSAIGSTFAAPGSKPTLRKCKTVATPSRFRHNSLIVFCEHQRPGEPDKPIASVWINYPSSTVMLHTTSPVPQIAAIPVKTTKAIQEVYLCKCTGHHHVGLIDVAGKLLTPQVCTDKCREYKAA